MQPDHGSVWRYRAKRVPRIFGDSGDDGDCLRVRSPDKLLLVRTS
jgi:hypothetical protein